MSLFEQLSRLLPGQTSDVSPTPIQAVERSTAKVTGTYLTFAFTVTSDLRTDVGCVRTSNEDNGRIFRQTLPTGAERYLIVVADGMGGYNAGEVASALVIETMEAFLSRTASDPERSLKASVESANTRIYRQSLEHTENAGMGTTCTALLLQDGLAYTAHVGDSRLYLLRDGGIYQMSEEHSQVMDMVRAGVLELGEARHHPDKNVITRALGRQEHVEVSTWLAPLSLRVGDGFLLCSDGLCDQIEDEEINMIAQTHTVSNACDELVRLAKERGGSDNITVALVRLMQAGSANETSNLKATRQMEVSA
jgi:serine/threonine protein phosphatase PrpC